MMLTQPQTEKFCRLTPRAINTLRNARSLPFTLEPAKPHARLKFTPAQVFFFLLQKELASDWKLTLAEAAWAIRTLNDAFFSHWELATRDGWILRKRVAPDKFDYFLADRAGVRDLITEPAGEAESFPWSAETLEVGRKMRAAGASEAAIVQAFMELERERIIAWGASKEQRFWIFSLSPVFGVMESAAADMKVPLPAREDRDAWFGSNA